MLKFFQSISVLCSVSFQNLILYDSFCDTVVEPPDITMVDRFLDLANLSFEVFLAVYLE